MTKADIVEKIQMATGVSKKDAAEMLESVLAIMKTSLESGENIKISGFGGFVVHQKAARRGRNPQTGKSITIEARNVLTFKSSSVLRQLINAVPA